MASLEDLHALFEGIDPDYIQKHVEFRPDGKGGFDPFIDGNKIDVQLRPDTPNEGGGDTPNSAPEPDPVAPADVQRSMPQQSPAPNVSATDIPDFGSLDPDAASSFADIAKRPAAVAIGGAVKSLVSGVPQLYGLAGATMDYATKDQTFAESMFKPGGLEALTGNVKDFATQYTQDHPDADTDEVTHAVDNYRATPQFYSFQTDQMRPGISQGMKAAMAVNTAMGIGHPDKESALDQATEIIGSALIPSPGFGVITKMAGNIVPRIAKVADKAVGAMLPGTSKYTPTGIATNAGIGLGVNTAIGAVANAKSHRAAPVDPNAMLSVGMTDPRNGQPVTSPARISDPIEAAHQNAPNVAQPTLPPSGAPQRPLLIPAPKNPLAPPSGGPKAPVSAIPTVQQNIAPQSGPAKVIIPNTIDQSSIFAGAIPSPAGMIGGALGVLGGAALAYKGGKYARSAVQRLRGQSPVNVDAFRGQPSRVGPVAPAIPRETKINASPSIRGNLNNPATSATLPGRVLTAFDKAFNKDAPIEKQARDIGGGPLETIIQSQLGTKLSPGARAADKAKLMHEGLLPDGTHTTVVPQDFFDTAAQATQPQREAFTRLIQSLNIQTRRDASLNHMLNTDATLSAQILRSSGARRTVLRAARQDNRTLLNLRRVDDPSSRITFGQVPDDVVNSNITQARADPLVRQLEDMYRSISRDLTDAQFNAGVLTQEEHALQTTNSHYSPLFEFEYKKKADVRANNNAADPTMPDAAPERAVDAFSGMAFKISNAVDEINTNVGHTRVINAFRASDPQAQVVREVDSPNPFGTVSVLSNGVPEHYQFARPAVAEALKSQSLDVGNILQMGNKARTLFQQLVTGPVFGTLYTPLRSVIFDGIATQATHRPGRAFGIASHIAQRAAIANPRFQRMADLITSIDPTGPLIMTPLGGIHALDMHIYKGIGDRIARMARMQSPIFQQLAAIPGGQQFLQNMGARMAHAYDSSVIHAIESTNGIHVHQMVQDSLSVRNELEGFMRTYQNAGRSNSEFGRRAIDPTARVLQSIYQGYSGLNNNIHNASRYAYAAQSLAIETQRLGRPLTEQERRTLGEEVRRSAGDLAGQPGSRGLKQFESVTPYSNIAFQSMRHIIHATARDPMQVGLTVFGLSGALYASYKVIQSRGPEAENWYWNRANPWERVGAIRAIPKPDTMLYMAQNGGHLPPWNPHDPMGEFYDIAVSPELMPLITMNMAAYEALGLMPRPNDATSMPRDMGFALSDSMAVGTNVLLNAGMIATTGNTVNFTAAGSGRGIIQGPQVSRGTGANADKTLSGTPSWIPQMMTATMGLAGTSAYQMIDQGVQAYNDGQSFASIAQRVGTEGEEFLKLRPAVPDIPFIYNAPAKTYRSTPASRRISELEGIVRGTMGKSKGLDAAWSVEYGKEKGTPLAMQAPHIQDQQILQMLSDTHNAYLRGGAIKDNIVDASQMRKQVNQYEIDKVKTPIDEISSGKFHYGRQELLLKWQALQDRALQGAEDFNKYLSDTYGDRFKKEGVPPTVEGVAALVHRYARPLQPGEQPLSMTVKQQGG